MSNSRMNKLASPLMKYYALELLKKVARAKHAKVSKMPEDIDQSESLSVADKELGTNAKLFREHFVIKPRPAPTPVATKVPIPIWRPGYMATPGSPIKYDPFTAEVFAGKPMPRMFSVKTYEWLDRMIAGNEAIRRRLEQSDRERKARQQMEQEKNMRKAIEELDKLLEYEEVKRQLEMLKRRWENRKREREEREKLYQYLRAPLNP